MKKLQIVIELTLDEEPRDKEKVNSLYDILYQRGFAANDELILYSNFVGDMLGLVRVIEIKEPSE